MTESRNEDGRVEAGRDPGPIDDEAMKAVDGREAPAEVGEHHREMDKIGANARGEGRVP